jgi:hypothetical protein
MDLKMDLKALRKKTLANLRVTRWAHPDKTAHGWGLIQGLAEIADGLVTLLSLGFYSSNIEMQVAFYRSYSHHLRKKHAIQQGGRAAIDAAIASRVLDETKGE